MKTRGIMMKVMHEMEKEILTRELRIDLMRKASKRFEKRGESLKANIAEALMRNEKNQKTYYEGVLAGYRLSLRIMTRRE